jgi:hypothetical protein
VIRSNRLWLIVVLAGTAVVAASCSSSPHNASGSTTTTTQAPASSTSSSATSTTTSSSTTTSTTASGCTGITAAVGQTQGAAGTITGSIVVSSGGSAPCSLTGYPTIALYSSSGASLPVTVIDGLSVDISSDANGTPKSVTLSPTSKLEFTYQFSDVPTGTQTACPSSSMAAISLPGGRGTSPQFPLTLDPCNNGTIRVSPLYPHT